MNRNLYRIVFNKARGLLMVVAENVSSQGKSPGTSAGAGARSAATWVTLTRLRFAMFAAMGLMTLVPPLASAESIVADASSPSAQQPMIINSANGAPQVNIRAPSAAGVSHNTYSQFDVDGRGVILNNASGHVQTQLGGWIEGNPLLGHSSARVILNEVNSSNPSQLQGYTEVAGQRAEVIIANPAGITCSGCGFINATRSTLTTGHVQMENGAITGFRVQGGTLRIEGNGLDASQTDYTDLIARAVEVNAGIWAHDLTVTAGRNRVSPDNKQIEALADDGQPTPSVAIDVAQLGGMYAGKIMLVGTEAGVGVRNAGQIGAMAGDVVITADGKIQNAGTVTSAASVQLKTAAGIDNSGTLYGKGNVVLDSAQQVVNSTTIAAQGNVTIKAGSVLGKAGSTLAAGLNTDGSLAEQGALDISADSVVLDGALTQGLGLSIHANSLSNRDGQILQLGAEPLRINVAGLVDNRLGVITSSGDASLTVGGLDNTKGSVLSSQSGNLVITAQDRIDNGNGVIAAGGNATLSAQSLDNRGGLMHSGQRLEVTTSQLDNSVTSDSEQGIEGSSIQLTADRINNENGAVRADNAIGIGVSQTLNNQNGLISAGTQLSIRDRASALQRQSILNEGGTLIGGQLLALDTAYFAGAGRLLSLGDLSFHSANALTLDGLFQANHSLVLQLGEALTVNGTLSAGSSLQVDAQSLDNHASGAISAAAIDLGVSGDLVNRGLLDGQQVRLQAGSLTNLGTGRLYGDQLAIVTKALINRDEHGQAAVIAARETLNIGTDTLLNREQALIFSAGDLAIGKALSSSGQAEGRAQWLDNASATIEALGNLALDVQRLRNTNEHFRTQVVEVSRGPVQEFQLSGSVNRYTPEQITTSHHEVDYLHTPEGASDSWNRYDYTRVVQEDQVLESAPAQILSGHTMHLSIGDLLNDKSQIIAGGSLLANVDMLNNTEVSGERVTTDQGSVTHFYRDKKKGRDEQGSSVASYRPASVIQSISLSPTRYLQNTQVEGSGTQLNGHAGQQVTEQTAAVGTTPIRTVESPISLPANSLFQTNPDASSHYLVVTDPRFASYRDWMSSDYMLRQLKVDPAHTQQRLGDGFYEQKLIREQIAQLTGRRFLTGYASDGEQYRALIDNAVTLASQWQLVPGIALTAAQMAALTSDIVWLVEQPVTLANGEVRKVLVPQVYVRVEAGDLDGSGALIAGQQLQLNVNGDVINSGTLAGRNVLSLTAENIHNLGGRIEADTATLQARQNLNNLGGTIGAVNALAISAGHDITVASTTQDSASVQGSRTQLSRVAGLYVSGADGTMQVAAGNDLTLNAAQVVNAGNGATELSAGRDINLGTVTEAEQQSIRWDASNWRNDASRTEAGTTIQGTGNLQLRAGQDINARGATVSSEQGVVQAEAQRDINLSEAQRYQFADEAHRSTGSNGLFSSTTTTTRDTLSQTLAQGTTLSGEQTHLHAGRDINVRGSNVVSTTQTELLAGRNITLEAASDRVEERHDKTQTKSGLFSGGGIALTLGTQQQSADDRSTQRSAVASTVGATRGDVVMTAGKDYRQVGSHVAAPEGDITINAEHIDILEGRELSSWTQESRFKQSGVSVTITNPLISAIQTAQHMHKAAQSTDDKRLQTLALANTALGAYSASNAVGQNPAQAGGINISISLGSQKNENTVRQQRDTSAASTVMAGHDITLNASGAGSDSHLAVQGSQIKAGHDASLISAGDINLLAATDTFQQDSDSKGSSASVGIGFALGGTQNGFTLNLGVSGNRGESDGKDTTHTNTHVDAGNTLLVKSGGDTTLKGAVATGEHVVADIGRDLHIESLQDTSTYTSKEKSLGVGLSLCVPPFCYGLSGSVSFDKSDVDSNYASVTEQSGFKAGDGGFAIHVNGNTDLKGGLIASSDAAIEAGRNQLSTGTLTQSDIHNAADAKASSSGMGLSSDVLSQGKYGASKAIADNALNTGKASSSSSGDTHSAISAGHVAITNEALQQQLTGQNAADTLASLNRDTSNAHTAAERQDIGRLRHTAEAEQAIKSEAYRQTEVFTENAYKTMFVKDAETLALLTDENGNVLRDADNNPRIRELTEEEKVTLKPGADGYVHIAENGIFNDRESAAKYAAQHSTSNGPQYFTAFPPAENALSELLIAGYQNFLENGFWGLTNANQATENAMLRYGKTGLHLDGHSRGSMTIGNALESLSKRPDAAGILSNTTITFFGPAYNAVKADQLLSTLQNRDAMSDEQKNKMVLGLQNHAADPVGRLIGGNFSTGGTIPENSSWFKEIMKVMGGEHTVHNCYGHGGSSCKPIWRDMPTLEPETIYLKKP